MVRLWFEVRYCKGLVEYPRGSAAVYRQKASNEDSLLFQYALEVMS